MQVSVVEFRENLTGFYWFNNRKKALSRGGLVIRLKIFLFDCDRANSIHTKIQIHNIKHEIH